MDKAAQEQHETANAFRAAEKSGAFNESWDATFAKTCQNQQELAKNMLTACTGFSFNYLPGLRQIQSAALDMSMAGFFPNYGRTANTSHISKNLPASSAS
ncbi:hypothetical protein [Undibacterium sp. TJN19]|uniref:hypothetical protein n=1 Tax=Undibacterium sp. TJN19 TaxID=3413055 RepID=UPI003BF42C9C